MKPILPLSPNDILQLALAGKPIPADRVLATFADPKNWIQVYRGETVQAGGYEMKACEWAFIGPMRPPYELAQHALVSLADPSSPGSGQPAECMFSEITELITATGAFYNRPPDERPSQLQEYSAAQIVKRAHWRKELEIIRAWQAGLKPEEKQYFPQKLSTLLDDWAGQLDRAHRAKQAAPPVKKFGVRGTL